MNRPILLVPLLLAAILAVVLTAARAQERAEQGKAMRFQRIYAPAERMKDWPTGGEKYLPLEKDEFSELLSLVRSGAADEQGSFSVQITAAEYRARLEGERLLTGQAILDINHGSQSATMLPMEPCNVAIQQATWLLPDPNAEQQTKKAILGLDPKGKLQVIVEQSGKLSFDWSLAGQYDSSEAMVFSCEFPACPVGLLWLDLPENLTPAMDKGLVRPAEAAAEGRRRWRVELGGQCRFHLRLTPFGAANTRPPLALLRESSVYEFSPHGVDLSAQWKTQIHNEALEKISVLLEPGLQLATARLGDVALSWTIEPLANDAGARAVLLLPEPLRDTERILRLGALAPLNLNRRFRLPRMQAEGFFWQEGGITLNVLDPLIVEQLTPIHCSQKAVGPLAEPRIGESLQFQNFSPDAGIELTLAQPRAQTQLLSATAVEIGSRQIIARMAIAYRADDTAQFTMEAAVSKSWLIDSVESIPAEALADWSVENQADNQQKLVLRLSKIPSQKQALRLVVSARRLRIYVRRQWSIEELLPLRFSKPVENKRLAAIEAAGPFELKLSGGEELTRLSARNLSAAELELFANAPGDLLFLDDAGAVGAEITLMPQKPAYSSNVLVEAQVSKGRLQERYVLHCVPESTRVDRVIIQLSETRDAPPRWTLESEDEKQLSVRQLSKGEQASASLGAGGETWELTLRRPRSTPFEIHGTRETAVSGSQSVCLAVLPEAVSQSGMLVVHNSAHEELRIENSRLKSIPPEPVAADQYSTVRATYRFDPVHDVSLATEPALKLSVASKEALPSIFAWNCRLESWYQAQGGALHRACFEMENVGGSRLQLVLPPGVSTEDLRGAWLDDLPVSWQQTSDHNSGTPAVAGGDIVSLPLPAEKRFPTISIYFVTHESALGTFGSLSPPLPKLAAPMLAGTWTLWLPPGFEVIAEDPRGQTPRRPQFSCSQRLFGPLGRAATDEPMHPLAAAGSRRPPTEESKSFWIHGSLAGCKGADSPGWIAECLELSTVEPVQVKYVHRFGRQCWAMLIFLLCLALGYWKAAQRPILFTILTGAFAISAFVLTEAYVPLASAAVLGMLACLLLRIILLHIKTSAAVATPAQNSADESRSSGVKAASAAGQAGAVLLMVGVSTFFAISVKAEEATEKIPSSASADYRVFIPIDAEKKPVGDKVYLPEQFYNELHRLAVKAKQEPQGWLLGSATYRGSLVREAPLGRLTPEAIKAQFDLRIFGRLVRVKLPFRRENADIVADSIALDKRPVSWAWEADGGAISFEVEEPGNYRLELALKPRSCTVGTSAGFEMTIPRLAQSRLELLVPAEAAEIEVPSAIGAVRLQSDPTKLLADLGPSDRLSVRWPDNSRSGPRKSTMDVDQFTWLKVQSGSVVVDVRWKFHILEGQISRLQLATDPRLRLLPLQGKDAPIVDIHSEYAQPQIVTLQWNRPLTDETVLDLSFLMTSVSGVGKFRLPQIKLLDAPAIKRWLAISSDPMLEFESQRSPDLETTTAAEFLKNWGASTAPPLQAYRLLSDEVDWSFSTRPREPETSVEQTLALSFDQHKVEAYFNAQLKVAAGYVFQYQLSAPAAMKVIQVSLQKEGVEQAARWSQGRDGTITIFLKGPADGEQQLSLHGLMPLESEEKIPLPSISLKQCRVQSTTLQVFRHPAVQLEITVPKTMKSMPNSSGETDLTEQGRAVRTFRIEGDAPLQGEVRLQVNRPDIQARQVTRLSQEGRQWTAKADFLLAVSEGVMDQFWIDVPDSWKEPYTVDAPATVKIVEIPGERRRLLIQPRFAVSGDYLFSISGTLEFKSGEAPAAPDIFFRGAKEYSRWLVLPRQLKDQPIGWEIHGLLPAELPHAMAILGEEKDNFVYEGINETFSATLRSQTVRPASAKVQLADIRLAWQADGRCRGAATFNLEPGGQKFCPLLMPNDYELVLVTIDNMPVAPLPLGLKKWQLPLVSERLPQRISVVFQGTVSDPLRDGLRNFSTPSLGDLPVRETLWTVRTPPSLVPQTDKDGKTTTLCQQQRIRLRNAAEMITSGAELLQLDDQEETLRWYRLQARYLMAARAALQNELNLMPASASTLALKKEIEAIDQQQAECAQRMGLSNVWTQVKAEKPVIGEAEDCCQQWLNEPGNVARYAIEGPATALSVDYQLRARIGPCARFFAVLCLAGVVFAIILGMRRGTWIALLNERPYAVGIAAGLAWWCWLRPSLLGLVIALVCLIAWWRARSRDVAEKRPAPMSS